ACTYNCDLHLFYSSLVVLDQFYCGYIRRCPVKCIDIFPVHPFHVHMFQHFDFTGKYFCVIRRQFNDAEIIFVNCCRYFIQYVNPAFHLFIKFTHKCACFSFSLFNLPLFFKSLYHTYFTLKNCKTSPLSGCAMLFFMFAASKPRSTIVSIADRSMPRSSNVSASPSSFFRPLSLSLNASASEKP